MSTTNVFGKKLKVLTNINFTVKIEYSETVDSK